MTQPDYEVTITVRQKGTADDQRGREGYAKFTLRGDEVSMFTDAQIAAMFLTAAFASARNALNA